MNWKFVCLQEMRGKGFYLKEKVFKLIFSRIAPVVKYYICITRTTKRNNKKLLNWVGRQLSFLIVFNITTKFKFKCLFYSYVLDIFTFPHVFRPQEYLTLHWLENGMECKPAAGPVLLTLPGLGTECPTWFG